MDIFEIRLFKDENDFNNRISCYCERAKGTKEEIKEKAKALATRFNTIYWLVDEYK